MAGKEKLITGALEGLTDVFRKGAGSPTGGGNLFETKSYNNMVDGMIDQYRSEYGSDLTPSEINDFLFTEDSSKSLKDFFAQKINIDDLDYEHDDLSRLILDLQDEGFEMSQIFQFIEPNLK